MAESSRGKGSHHPGGLEFAVFVHVNPLSIPSLSSAASPHPCPPLGQSRNSKQLVNEKSGDDVQGQP